MLLNITFGLMFFGGIVVLWYRITQKIPELVAIPDSVISERLLEDSAKVRLFVLHFKTLWREGYFGEFFFKTAGKFLRRVHIILLRTDNAVVGVLQGVQARSERAVLTGKPAAEYWGDIKMREPAGAIAAPATAANHMPIRAAAGVPARVTVTKIGPGRGRMVREMRPMHQNGKVPVALPISADQKFSVASLSILKHNLRQAPPVVLQGEGKSSIVVPKGDGAAERIRGPRKKRGRANDPTVSDSGAV